MFTRRPFSLDAQLKSMTQIFFIERDSQQIGNAHGFFAEPDYPNTIQLVENIDVKQGDWLIDSVTNQRYFALNTKPLIMNGTPVDWLIEYQTEYEYNRSLSSGNQTNINIHSVSGNSVIGSQQNVTLNIGNSLSDIEKLISTLPEVDRSEAQELLDELQKTESSAHPILVEGTFSKFSNLLKKHTDLLTAVGGWAVQLLIGKQ